MRSSVSRIDRRVPSLTRMLFAIVLAAREYQLTAVVPVLSLLICATRECQLTAAAAVSVRIAANRRWMLHTIKHTAAAAADGGLIMWHPLHQKFGILSPHLFVANSLVCSVASFSFCPRVHCGSRHRQITCI